MIINNIEMLDLDVYDLEVAENYEKALELLQGIEEKTKNKGIAEGIKIQCNIIFDFFNIMYGEGADRKIFGDKVNLVTCLDALGEFMEQFNTQGTNTFNSINNKYSPNRAKRRK